MLDDTQVQDFIVSCAAFTKVCAGGAAIPDDLRKAVVKLNNQISQSRRENAKRPTARKVLEHFVDELRAGALLGGTSCPAAYVTTRREVAKDLLSHWVNIVTYDFDKHIIWSASEDIFEGQRRTVTLTRHKIHMAVLKGQLTVWVDGENPSAVEIAARRQAADCTGRYARHQPFDTAMRRLLDERKGAVTKYFASAQAEYEDAQRGQGSRGPGRPPGAGNNMSEAKARATAGYTPLPGSTTKYYRAAHFIENAHGATCSIEVGTLAKAGSTYSIAASTLMHGKTSPQALRNTPVRFLLGHIPRYQGAIAAIGASFSLACKQIIHGTQYLADANGVLHVYVHEMYEAYVRGGAAGLAELLGTRHPSDVSDARSWAPAAALVI